MYKKASNKKLKKTNPPKMDILILIFFQNIQNPKLKLKKTIKDLKNPKKIIRMVQIKIFKKTNPQRCAF